MAARIVLVICLTTTVQMSIQTDLFTSVIDMENFVQTQSKVIESIENYIAIEEERIKILKRLLVPYKQSQEKAVEDVPYYVQNPINAFSLIKRLSVGLNYIEAIIKTPPDYERNQEVTFPDEEDLQAAGEALIRIQTAYNLNITELSRGVLKTNYSHNHSRYEEKFAPMSSSDCYEIGKAGYSNRNSANALPWILQAFAINALEDKATDELSFTNLMDIVELICLSYIEIGDIDNAMKWIEELAVLVPKYPNNKVSSKITNYLKDVEENTVKPKSITNNTEKRNIYYQLCRGDIEVPADIAKGLTCRYLTDTHPYLRIAPVKTEQLYIDPFIMLVYDVVDDDAIDAIKEQAQLKKLQRAVVVDKITGKNIGIKTRISKTTWLPDSASDRIKRLSRRLHHFTHLTLDTAENLQVANYGIGGVYESHHDFVLNDTLVPEEGHRIATILFYLSDVTQGGATVFLNLKLTVFPVKGAALFWINLYDTGARDLRLKHASCPVLRGNKWAANKWLHEHGQEWVRPCPLNPKHEVF